MATPAARKRLPRNLLLVFSGQLFSTLGDFLFTIALMAVIFQETGSGLAVGYLVVAQTAPRAILGPFAGVWVDRLNPRRVMIVSDLLRAGVVLLLLLGQSVTLIYAVTSLLSATGVFFDPPRSSFMPRAFSRELLLQSNSIIATGKSLIRLVGPALGAWLTAVYGAGPAIWGNALSFGVSALCIALVPVRFPAQDGAVERTHFWSYFWTDLRAGLRYLAQTPVVRGIVLVGVLALLGIAPVSVLLVAFVQEQLGLPPANMGYLVSAEGVGAVLAGLVMGVLAQRLGLRHLLTLGLGVVSLSLVALAGAQQVAAALVAVGVAGAGMVASNVAVETGLQMSARSDVLGRVFSLTMTLFMLTQSAAAGATGWLADLFSVRTVFLGGAGLLVLTAGLGWVTLAAAAQAKTEGGAAADTPAGQEAKGRAIEEAPAG